MKVKEGGREELDSMIEIFGIVLKKIENMNLSIEKQLQETMVFSISPLKTS